MKPIKKGFRDFGDWQGQEWAVYPPTVTDKEIIDSWEWEPYYFGPGREYAHTPYIRRTSTRVLVTQSCGRDV